MVRISTTGHKPSTFYQLVANGVQCTLCPHYCTLKEGEIGRCHSRQHITGKIVEIGYGNLCAKHIDPVEKKPLYHFLPGTLTYSIASAGCNLTCLNCQNSTISQYGPSLEKNKMELPGTIIEECLKSGCPSLSFTYTEPATFYEYMFDTALLAREKGIKNIMVSSGYINEKPLREITPLINAANIDLKAFSIEVYRKMCGGSLAPVLKALEIIREEAVWLEITHLLIPGWTDDWTMIRDMCQWLATNGFKNCPIHFSCFHPRYQMQNTIATPFDTLEDACNIAKGEGLQYVYYGNVHEKRGGDTICPTCLTMLIERQGNHIIQNKIEDGNCQCGGRIPGVWQ